MMITERKMMSEVRVTSDKQRSAIVSQQNRGNRVGHSFLLLSHVVSSFLAWERHHREEHRNQRIGTFRRCTTTTYTRTIVIKSTYITGITGHSHHRHSGRLIYLNFELEKFYFNTYSLSHT